MVEGGRGKEPRKFCQSWSYSLRLQGIRQHPSYPKPSPVGNSTWYRRVKVDKRSDYTCIVHKLIVQ